MGLKKFMSLKGFMRLSGMRYVDEFVPQNQNDNLRNSG